MDIRIIHFYPEQMSLYGSYANLSVLRRMLEQMGCRVTVDLIRSGEKADLAHADFLFMGAGTERAQKAALADFLRYADAVNAAAADGCAMLFCGTAMELLGKTITDADGIIYNGIGLASFSSVQGKQRFVEDVLGTAEGFSAPIVGFMNKCSRISGVESPLISAMDLGFGNDGPKTPEGYHRNNVFASHLTGPLLVKNPQLLEAVVRAIFLRRGKEPTDPLPHSVWAKDAYASAAEQLRLRANG